MSSDHEAEIRASVAAHADLGPGYDDAVAEGLVERIGAEIDKRIDARLGQFGAVPGAGGPAGSPGYQPPAQAGYQGYQGYMVLLIWVAIAVINVAYARRP